MYTHFAEDVSRGLFYARSAGVSRPNPEVFLSTTRGKIVAATAAAAAIGAGIALWQNKSAAAAASSTPGTTPSSTPGTAATLLFNVAYPSTAGSVTVGQVQADLAAAGFQGALVQPDVTAPAGSNAFIVAAVYPPGGPYAGPIQTAVTSPPSPGALAFTIAAQSLASSGGTIGIYNVDPIVSLPEATTAQCTVGTWYAFSVRTSFLQGVPGAQADVLSLLMGLGFGSAASPTLFVQPVTMSDPTTPIPASDTQAFDTWNVIAQYNGRPGATTIPVGYTVAVPDLPPLLLFVPGATPTAIAAPIGTPTPSNVMP